MLLCFIMGCTGVRNMGQNPYNLDIVTDLDVYRKQVWANPENALSDIQQAIPDVVLDMRYATKDNFTGRVIYRMSKAFARLKVVEALKLVQAFMDLDPESIKNRELLKGVMTHFGFDIYPDEWWHYDFRGWENYPLMDIPFGKLISAGTGTRKN